MVKYNGVDYFMPAEVARQMLQGSAAQVPLSKPAVVKGKQPIMSYMGNGNFRINLGKGNYINMDRDANTKFALGALGTVATGGAATTIGIPATVGAMLGATAGNAAVNGITNALTGKSWDEWAGKAINNISPMLSPELGMLTNPGSWAGGAHGYFVAKPAYKIAKGLIKEGAAGMTPMRALGVTSDVLLNPKITNDLLVSGRYAYNLPSLRRMMRQTISDFSRGAEFTNSELAKLNNTSPFQEAIANNRKAKISLSHKLGNRTTARTDMDKDGNTKYVTGYLQAYPKTYNRLVARPSKYNVFIGGHEAVHGVSNQLGNHPRNLFYRLYQPSINYIDLGKIDKSISTYYIPDRDNPVSDKYYDFFMKATDDHGKYPEETLANYYGYKVSG